MRVDRLESQNKKAFPLTIISQGKGKVKGGVIQAKPHYYEFIVSEIEKLDILTSEKVASHVPVKFHKSRMLLGQYINSPPGNDFFSFSYELFDDPRVSKALKIFIVRHEYCHYLAHLRFHADGHGAIFRRLCKLVDCSMSPKLADSLIEFMSM